VLKTSLNFFWLRGTELSINAHQCLECDKFELLLNLHAQLSAAGNLYTLILLLIYKFSKP